MDKFTAAESIRRLALQYQAMVDAADTLEKLGSIERYTVEQQAQAEAAKAESVAAKAELAEVKVKIKKAVDDANAKLNKLTEGATGDAATAIRNGEETAAEIIKKAQDEASMHLATVASDKARLSSELGALQSAISAAKAEVKKLDQDRQQAESAAADSVKKLEVAQGKIRALAGL